MRYKMYDVTPKYGDFSIAKSFFDRKIVSDSVHIGCIHSQLFYYPTKLYVEQKSFSDQRYTQIGLFFSFLYDIRYSFLDIT